ncbi:MAG: cytochrome c3 family protein [Thermodesulfobacteriota bacterium]
MVKNRLPIVLTLSTGALTLVFLYLVYVLPGSTMGPRQPIPFSHRVHAGVKAISCEFCHPYAHRSSDPGIPAVEKCLYCHNYIISGHPWIQKEHDYYNTGTPVPWKKVFYVPEHVFFNHQRHIKKEIECRVCHGAIETMDRLQRNRFKMGFCIECHKEKKASVDCWLACHN